METVHQVVAEMNKFYIDANKKLLVEMVSDVEREREEREREYMCLFVVLLCLSTFSFMLQ